MLLGEASFGLYLIHIPTYHIYQHLQLQRHAAFYPLYVLTSIGLSVMSFYWIESPSRRWILKRFKLRPKETMEMASDAQ